MTDPKSARAAAERLRKALPSFVADFRLVHDALVEQGGRGVADADDIAAAVARLFAGGGSRTERVYTAAYCALSLAESDLRAAVFATHAPIAA